MDVQSHLPCPPLTSEPFNEALHFLHNFGDVERLLKDGKNPLIWKNPAGDFIRLCDAVRGELAADFAGVLRAANAGAGEGELSGIARLVVDRHCDRTITLKDWLCDL